MNETVALVQALGEKTISPPSSCGKLFYVVRSCLVVPMFCCFCCCRHDVMMAHTWIQALLSARQKKLLRPDIVKTKSFFDFKRSKLDLKFIRCAILKKLFLIELYTTDDVAKHRFANWRHRLEPIKAALGGTRRDVGFEGNPRQRRKMSEMKGLLTSKWTLATLANNDLTRNQSRLRFIFAMWRNITSDCEIYNLPINICWGSRDSVTSRLTSYLDSCHRMVHR